MDLLTVLIDIEPMLSQPDIKYELREKINDVIYNYDNGIYDFALTLLGDLITDINNEVGYMLITDYSVTYEVCAIQLYDGSVLQVM